MDFLDANGDDLYIGASVEVPVPEVDDLWNFEFSGVIIEFNKEGGYVVVEDGDGDCWCVEPQRLILE